MLGGGKGPLPDFSLHLLHVLCIGSNSRTSHLDWMQECLQVRARHVVQRTTSQRLGPGGRTSRCRPTFPLAECLCALRPTVEQALLEHSSDPQINQYTMAATMVKSARNPQQKPPLLLPAHGCSRHLVSLDGSVIGHEACLCAVAPADCDCAPAGGLPARQS